MDAKNTWSVGLKLHDWDVGRLEYSALILGHPPAMPLLGTISWDVLEIDKSDTERAAKYAKSEQHGSPVSGRVRMPIADINRTAEVRVPRPYKTRLTGRPKPPRIRGGRRDGG